MIWQFLQSFVFGFREPLFIFHSIVVCSFTRNFKTIPIEMSAIKSVFKLVSPAFYRQQWKEYIADLSKDIVSGKPQPFFKAILLIGVVGYTMEYTQVGSKLLYLII